ncbi:MAG TPA: FmdB family zinc ribbon protein [bacterium]|nr:FmdB family zinc ribbon protein [bacterium]
MTYVFRCASCRHEFEIIATVAEYENQGLPACPKCGKAAAKRVFTPVMVMTGARGSDAGDLPSGGGGCCGGGACGCGHVH